VLLRGVNLKGSIRSRTHPPVPERSTAIRPYGYSDRPPAKVCSQMTQINADPHGKNPLAFFCVIGKFSGWEGGKSEPAGDGATRRPEADRKSEIRNPKLCRAGEIPNSEFLIPNSGRSSGRPVCYLCIALHGVGILDGISRLFDRNGVEQCRVRT
jgi:hypothetical protein